MPHIDILIQECEWQVTGIGVRQALLVALVDGGIVGSSIIRRDTRSTEEVYLESTFVNESHRRMGIATMLNEKSLEMAESLGARRVWVSVYRGNRFYLRWFLGHGFRVHGKNEARDTVLICRDL